mgnify:FL=1|tara:strand:+ start:2021 stop:2221 length:201 start_codon:yes stop_codon:yes gene_type:complete
MSNMRVGRQSGKWICWNCDCDDIRERIVININTGERIERPDVYDDFWCNECGENEEIGEVLYGESI